MDTPIIAGFHPDPSVCRVGEWFYLANSSFEYVPGVPIHRSRDLVSWELVGHALPDAASVNAPLGAEGASKGIFAPTLRHHDGRFWLTTTSIRSVMNGQMITWADDPAGPWSSPVFVPGTPGIDPDLTWDEDGTCYLTYKGFMPSGIHQVAIDPLTGTVLGDDTVIWEGSGLAECEGPHVFRRDRWWYLLVAEGGTHTGHGISIARSLEIGGPYESCPQTPFYTHRSTNAPVQATGHGDMVELADGRWAMVHLGIRQRGSFPRFHVLGRETFAVGIDWVDGWPVVDEESFLAPRVDGSYTDEFDQGGLDPHWVAPGEAPRDLATLPHDGGVRLGEGRAADAGEQGRALCRRVTDHDWEAVVELGEGDLCVSVRLDASHWYGIERVGSTIRARAVSAPLDQIFAGVESLPGDRVVLNARTAGNSGFGLGPDTVTLAVDRQGERLVLAELDGRHLSTEVAGGFTGRMLALEALGGSATFAKVTYTSIAAPAA
ncbi:glycoside hydrolase family 43 protein [Demequina sp. NBRC 110057]|uniref:glycoside hydrolase family 43 protein n=1 Tax=Demequina sp. NBRC 110057 TaxID=1570346 RepID=UPI0009FCAD20|nr:glycoside hydrolase family 43 protein [Demequina sp. NBRC 110057]